MLLEFWIFVRIYVLFKVMQGKSCYGLLVEEFRRNKIMEINKERMIIFKYVVMKMNMAVV